MRAAMSRERREPSKKLLAAMGVDTLASGQTPQSTDYFHVK
jgi:hypothetical protein